MHQEKCFVASIGYMPNNLDEHIKTLGRVRAVKSPSGNVYAIIVAKDDVPAKEQISQIERVLLTAQHTRMVVADAVDLVVDIRDGTLFKSAMWTGRMETPYMSIFGIDLNQDRKQNSDISLHSYIAQLLSRHAMRGGIQRLSNEMEEILGKHPEISNFKWATFGFIKEVSIIWGKGTLQVDFCRNDKHDSNGYVLELTVNVWGFIEKVELAINVVPA
jgi:hypothetical protein